jgi:ABC-2 type transport system permease protein
MKSIIHWSLWQRKMFVFGWSIFTLSIIGIKMVVYPSFKDQADQLQKQFESLPPAMIKLIGGSTDFFSPVGYLNSQVYFFILPLILSIVSVVVFASSIGKEEESTSIENILARPISRTKFVVAKYIYSCLVTLIIALVALTITIIFVQLVNVDVPIKNILVVNLACFLLAISVGSISFVLSAGWLMTKKFATGAGLFFAIGGFVVSSLAATVSWLKGVSYIFPFEYYKSEDILYGNFHLSNLWVYIGIIVVCFGLSIIFFKTRDLS